MPHAHALRLHAACRSSQLDNGVIRRLCSSADGELFGGRIRILIWQQDNTDERRQQQENQRTDSIHTQKKGKGREGKERQKEHKKWL